MSEKKLKIDFKLKFFIIDYGKMESYTERNILIKKFRYEKGE